MTENLTENDKSQQNHEELMEMLGGIFVQVSRMYDALVIALPPEAQEEILQAHESGGLLGDPPTLREDAWDETVHSEADDVQR